MRKAIAAGQFYAEDKEALSRQIESCFKHNLGAGMPRVPLPEKKIFGAVAPHAGYQYSGMCACHIYKDLTNKNFPEIFIIIGPNHSGHGRTSFALSLEDFETPFGIAKNNIEFGNALLEASEELQQDEESHKYEHSIEVQLPFLQFISKLVKKSFEIVPIVISTLDFDKCQVVASIITEAAKEQKKKVCVLASSDFTHYGRTYGFLPFSQNVKSNLQNLDRKSINHILKLDSKAFYSEATKTTICGTAPIVVAIEACKNLGARNARLLKYYTSGEISGDYSSAVGYAGVVFE